MPSLADTSLTSAQRRVLARFLDMLRDELGEDLRAVWLYGSRARGEQSHPDSDVDLIVIADGGRERHDADVHNLMYQAAAQEGDSPAFYSVFVHDLEWLRGRREIRSFFIQEVDRDKLVLHGSAL